MGYTLKPEPSIVMEYMSRGSLFRILRQHHAGSPLDSRFQRAVALSVARGMAYLHSRKPPILHLDLKSPNVLVDQNWRVKIAGAQRVVATSHPLAASQSAQDSSEQGPTTRITN
jgi:serine/threonine protein kinase